MKTQFKMNLAVGLLASLAFGFMTEAHAAIPKHVELSELMGSKWCATRKADDRNDKLIFGKDGKLTVQTFFGSGTIEKVRHGSWSSQNGKLSILLENRRDTLGYSINKEAGLLSLSTGTKAVACE